MNGVIRKLNIDRGFGFVRGEDGKERFFHHTAVVKPLMFATLTEDLPVSFLTNDKHDRGPRAEQIRPMDAADAVVDPEPVKTNTPGRIERIEEEGLRCAICPDGAVARVFGIAVCNFHINHGEHQSCNSCGRGPIVRAGLCILCVD